MDTPNMIIMAYGFQKPFSGLEDKQTPRCADALERFSG